MDPLSLLGLCPISPGLPRPRKPRSRCPPLCRGREQFRQALQIQQPPHQIGFVSNLYYSSPLETSKPMPAFRLAPALLDLRPRALRKAGPHRPAQPSHPLMHRFSSRRLGRNVGADASLNTRRQKRLGNLPLVRAHGLNAVPVLVMNRVDDVPPAVHLGGRPSNRFHIDPEQQPLPILQ